jgi:hypothetical protein
MGSGRDGEERERKERKERMEIDETTAERVAGQCEPVWNDPTMIDEHGLTDSSTSCGLNIDVSPVLFIEAME